METGYPENSVEPWGGSTNGWKSMCQVKPNQEIWGNSGLMFINWWVLRVCACLYGQAGRLTEFYEMCKSMDFARNFQFPVLEQVCFVVLLIGVVHYTTSSILGISASCTSIMTKNTFFYIFFCGIPINFSIFPTIMLDLWLCDGIHQCLSSRGLSKKAVTKLSLWVVCNMKIVDIARFEASCLLQFLHSNAAPEVFSLHNGGLCEGLLSRQGGNCFMWFCK